MEQQRALMGGVQLPSLLTVDIRVEDESAFIEALHQHHAHVGQSVGIDGGERHCGRVAWLACFCLLEPGGKQPQRLVGLREITAR